MTIFRPSVVVGDSRSGETAKYDGIYFLIQYLQKAPSLLRLVNVGNKDVKLNLVPVDFVVDGIAALAFDEPAAGKTIALADPDPLTTEQLFDVIAENLTGKHSASARRRLWSKSSFRRPYHRRLRAFRIRLFPTSFISQTYDTACRRRSVENAIRYHVPQLSRLRLANLLAFVKKHPQL